MATTSAQTSETSAETADEARPGESGPPAEAPDTPEPPAAAEPRQPEQAWQLGPYAATGGWAPPDSDPSQQPSDLADVRPAVRERVAKAAETAKVSANRETKRRVLPSTAVMGVGVGAADLSWKLTEAGASWAHFSLPPAVQTPVGIALSAATAFVAGVGWLRYRREKNKK